MDNELNLPFDPLKGVRATITRELEAISDDPEQRNRHAQEITRKIWGQLRPQFQEVSQNIERPDLSETVVAELENLIPHSKGILGHQSLLQSLQIADSYLGFVKRLTTLDPNDYSDRNPPPMTQGYALTDLYRDGETKDLLTFLTPKEHRFAANFNRAVDVVNKHLGIQTDLLHFGELAYAGLGR